METDQNTELDEELDSEDYEPEENNLGFDPSDIDIGVEILSLDNLINRIKHDEIDMNTDFQRHSDLWKPRIKSRLIESILIRLPLPAFYFDASNEDKWLIVDGLQRLSTIQQFVLSNKIRLRNLEFLPSLNGCRYNDLERNYKRRIKEYQVNSVQDPTRFP